jgi:hypothetical protein
LGNVPFAAFSQAIKKICRETKDYKQLFYKKSGLFRSFLYLCAPEIARNKKSKTVVYHLQQKEKK